MNKKEFCRQVKELIAFRKKIETLINVFGETYFDTQLAYSAEPTFGVKLIEHHIKNIAIMAKIENTILQSYIYEPNDDTWYLEDNEVKAKSPEDLWDYFRK